jgi:RNA polymerase-binding transcription factor DksA
MRTIIRIAAFVFAIWLLNHPNTKALIKGISSVAIDAPVEKARLDFRAEAEKQAKAREEARAKEIDAALEKMDHGKSD